LAPLIAKFFQEPLLEDITKALSFTFLITSGGIVLENFLIKELAFKQLFYRSFIASSISGTLTVCFALYGVGYWALVIQVYLNTGLLLFLTYLRVRWRPSFVYNFKYIKNLRAFSIPLLADQSINYWARNMDNLLVGKFFGRAELALYNRSYSLMLLPVRQISGSITRVLFPSLSIIKDDILKVQNIYLKISGIIALISFPIMSYLFVMSHDVILLLYGKQWLGAVPIFRILCFLGAMQSIGTLLGNVFMSQGKTKLLFRIGLFSKVLMISGIAIGCFLGEVRFVAIGYVLGSSIAFIPETYFLSRILKTKLHVIFLNIFNQLLCSVLMGVLLSFSAPYLDFPLIVRILISGIIAAISYSSFIYLTRDRSLQNILFLINERKKDRILSR
jgi:O-antigen/teichoic acid export membrane protein